MNFVKVLAFDIKETIWIKISRPFSYIPAVFGLVYASPADSLYADPSVFDDIEETMNNIKSEDENMAVCLLGDLNARTGTLPDVSHNDESGDQSVELCEILNSNFNVTKRSNKDHYVNNRGERLMELCNSIDLHIWQIWSR